MSSGAAAGSPPAISLLDAAPSAPPAPRRWPSLAVAAGGVALATALALGIAQAVIAGREADLEGHLRARLDALAQGSAEVVETWREGAMHLGAGLAGSPMLRRLVAEADAAGEYGRTRYLGDDLTYLQSLVDDLARQDRLLGVQLVDAEGEVLLRAGGASIPPEAPRRDALAALARTGAPVVEPPRVAAGHLVVDLLVPIAGPRTALPDDTRPIGALVLSMPVERALARALRPGLLQAPGERRALVVPGPSGSRVLAWGPDGPGLGPAPTGVVAGRDRAFGRIEGPGGPMLAVGREVAGLGWTALALADPQAAAAPAGTFARQARLEAMALALLLGTALAAGWWRQESRRQRELAAQHQGLAGRLDRQRRLLESVTDTVPDMIGLKDLRRRYLFANPALASAAGCSPEALLGRTDRDIFPPATAAMLDRLDREALAIGAVLVEDLELELESGRRILHLVEVPVREPDGRLTGVVAVARDVTPLAEARRQRERLVAQTVEVLVRAVELVDPYLLGHSFRVRDLAVRLAQELGLGEEATATLRLAASLSQVGKLFVPRDLLTKPERHTPEEERQMQGHVAHAIRVLEGVDLDLPVVAAIAQMHERLDGRGYPRGLEGAAIGTEGRVLAVADVFCARIRPRSYRQAISPAEALGHLRSSPTRYDGRVVAALATILERGREVLGSAAADGGKRGGPPDQGHSAGAISIPQLGPLPIA